MGKIRFSTIFSSVFTLFVIFVVVLLGPANAVSISVNVPSMTHEYGDLVLFVAKIDIDSDERIPIRNITAFIKDENDIIVSQCFFDVDGNKLSVCDENFESIEKVIDNSDYDFGNLIGTGLGNNESGVVGNFTTEFGYGYGYGYGDVLLNEKSQLGYNISWRIPKSLNPSVKYEVFVEVNTENNDNFFTYKPEFAGDINVVLAKPVAVLEEDDFSIFEGESIVLDASSSYDPNNLSIVSYEVYKGGNLVYDSSEPVFELSGFDIGVNDLDFAVVNEVGLRSDFVPFEVVVSTSFESDNFNLNVSPLIEQGYIHFDIKQLVDFDGRRVKLRPQVECLGIDINYGKKFMDTGLVLNEKDKIFKLKVKRDDFELKVPLYNPCEFRVFLVDEETGYEILLTDDVTFVDSVEEAKKDVPVVLNNGVDLINYIFEVFDKEFEKGYSTIDFNLKNDGPNSIDAEFTVSIPDLDLVYYEDVIAQGNSDAKVNIPIYIDDNTKSGKYAMRISYRIDGGELKTKYGYVKIK